MNNRRFLQKVLGKDEYIYLEKKQFPKQSVAASFCAKEAFSKAIGTGIKGFNLKDVELLRNEKGMPYFKFSGNALKIVNDKNLRLRYGKNSLNGIKDYTIENMIKDYLVIFDKVKKDESTADK